METTLQGWGFSGAGRLLFGRGAVDQLSRQVTRFRWRSALLIADRALVSLGFSRRVQDILTDASCETTLFCDFEPEPALESALLATDSVASSKPDVVVALGGGSCMDLAKIVAILLRHGGHPRNYFGFDRVPGPVLPLIAIPTTGGTGSEVSHAAVLTDRQAGIKVSTLSEFLRPAIAIVDPNFSDSCPPRPTADSGIDALVHAIEGHAARDWSLMSTVAHEARAYEGSHPLGRLLATEATRLIFNFLERAVNSPQDKEARDGMALAATYAGLAFSNCGVALVHGLEYPLGTLVHCSHGAGNGALLPYVMRFNLPEAHLRYAELGQAIGAPEGNSTTQAEWFIEQVIALRHRIKIPHQLREFGLREEDLDGIATKTSKIERLMTLNPRAATSQDLLKILRWAY